MADLIKKEIEAMYANLAASHAGDAVNEQAVCQVYTQDCVVMAPGQSSQQGQKGAVASIKSLHSAGARRAEVVVQEVVCAGGEVAVERGHFKLTGTDGGTVESGKHLVVWKKVGGVWKIYIDSWNSGV